MGGFKGLSAYSGANGKKQRASIGQQLEEQLEEQLQQQLKGHFKDGDKQQISRNPSETKSLSRPKLYRSYVDKLHLKGRLTRLQVRAAEELEIAYRLITGEVGYTVAKLEPKRDRAWQGGDEGAERQFLQLAYSLWRELSPKRTREVCFALILEGRGVKETERRLRIKNNTAASHICEGLDHFIVAKKEILRRARHFKAQYGK